MDSLVSTERTWIIPIIDKDEAAKMPDIQAAGGKGANLTRIARSGFPVPDGFLVTTAAYRAFVAANGLQERILAALPAQDAADLASLEQASAHIRTSFAEGSLPDELVAELTAEYRRLGEPAVAVRSSATAEDLPDMSFAGQQDTYLNIASREGLLKALVDCWSSLWTARAIGYRTRNHVSHTEVALAVVVQRMVESQASGVLFTANPLTGLRTEVVIDATLGLGEALVSGQVEPDHYVVDVNRQQIISKTLGSKAVAVRGQANGGTVLVQQDMKDRQALPDEQILALAGLGQQVADSYRFPQDIEWAWANERLYLLQSRPITSLFPTPEGMPAEPLRVMFSFGAIQGMLDPITPLGLYALRLIFATGAGLLGYHLTPETQTVSRKAGERMWADITALLRNSVGRRVAHTALTYVEPTILQALDELWDDPRLQPEKPGVRPRTLLALARLFFPLAGNVLLNLMAPQPRRDYILANSEKLLDTLRARCAQINGDRYQRLEQQASLLPALTHEYLPHTFILFISGVAAGMASFNQLNKLAKSLPAQPRDNGSSPWTDQVMELTRGLPHNPTTEMDLALWKTAQAIRSDPASGLEFQTYAADELARRYQAGVMAPAARQAVDRFLLKYGGRGLGEIDMGRPRWLDEPTHVFEMLAGYLQIEAGDQAPDVVFARSALIAQDSAGKLVGALRKARFGWLKARLARFFVGRVRELMGIRESPKFFAVRMMGLIRQELVKTGREFVQAGELQNADDLVYLDFPEMSAFAAREPRDWRALIAQRREAYRRELGRKQIPRVLLSDGRAFYEGLRLPTTAGQNLTGSPVSPGSVEGRVRVVVDPRQAHLLPGEILVCPGTDPSWTPLFLTAAGLVMEVGGMMTHGAVVAREYGIPAIVGVDRATSRLKTGQRIYLNGSTGQIILIE